MKVVVVNKFRDIKEDKIRHAGEVFTCSKQRFAEINKVADGDFKFVEEYVEPEETQEEPEQEVEQEPEETQE